MKKNNEIIIRRALISDINKLALFFIKAYGKNTIFQNKEFLMYYFDSFNNETQPFYNSLIAINSNNDIVSHYGGLFYKLKIKNKIVTNIWGVNAYTLPEWRGKKINSQIVNFIHKNNESNAVIGMPSNAPFFYKKLNYNIFNKKTLKRYIYIYDSKAFEISEKLGYDKKKIGELLKINNNKTNDIDTKKIVPLTKENYTEFNYNLNIDSLTTTFRNVDFLGWRIFNNPYINYRVYGFINNNKITSYIVLREEELSPTKYTATRIIDLFGDKEGINNLLNHTIKSCAKNGSIYIDFSMFGVLYENELLSIGFSKLENNDVCVLPMVTSPIENRPNHEFIVIQSKIHNMEVQKLTSENVYFTRIDGDRDRIARINQLKQL